MVVCARMIFMGYSLEQLTDETKIIRSKNKIATENENLKALRVLGKYKGKVHAADDFLDFVYNSYPSLNPQEK